MATRTYPTKRTFCCKWELVTPIGMRCSGVLRIHATSEESAVADVQERIGYSYHVPDCLVAVPEMSVVPDGERFRDVRKLMLQSA